MTAVASCLLGPFGAFRCRLVGPAGCRGSDAVNDTATERQTSVDVFGTLVPFVPILRIETVRNDPSSGFPLYFS